jgi:hypothetical protein
MALNKPLILSLTVDNVSYTLKELIKERYES